jgi:hypothetical protein
MNELIFVTLPTSEIQYIPLFSLTVKVDFCFKTMWILAVDFTHRDTEVFMPLNLNFPFLMHLSVKIVV